MSRASIGVRLVAAVAVAAFSGAGCGSGQPSTTTTAANLSDPATTVVSCEAISGGARYSGTDEGARVILDVISVPPEYSHEAAVRSGRSTRPYFAEFGLVLRGGVSPVEISVPDEWRNQVGISWGETKIVHSLQFPSCPPYGLPWNAFEGGVYLRDRKACVPLTFRSEGREATVRFGIGTRCNLPDR